MKTAVRMSLPQCTLLQFRPASFLQARSATREKSLLQTQTCLHSNYIGHFRQKTHCSTPSLRVKFNPVTLLFLSVLLAQLAFCNISYSFVSAYPQPGLKQPPKCIGCFLTTYTFTVLLLKLGLLCQMRLPQLSFIWLVALSTDFPQTNQNDLRFLLVEKENGKILDYLTAHVSPYFKECILYSYSGTPTKSISALFIFIYTVNGFFQLQIVYKTCIRILFIAV